MCCVGHGQCSWKRQNSLNANNLMIEMARKRFEGSLARIFSSCEIATAVGNRRRAMVDTFSALNMNICIWYVLVLVR